MIDPTKNNWHIAVARSGCDLLARVELDKDRVQVHVPVEWERWKHKNQYRIAVKTLLLSPYFFVRFRSNSEEEHAVVAGARGVRCVLLAGGKPSPIPPDIVRDHISREYAEQCGALTKPKQETIPLNIPYKILRGNGQGHVGILTALDRGTAFLDINGKLSRVSILDIEPVKAP